MMSSSIAIVIPIFNRFEFIHDLLNTLESQTLKTITVVIVDHGTKDLTLTENYSFPITILKRSADLWFTGAANEGFRYVLQELPQVDYVIHMNDDVIIQENRFLEILLSHAGSQKVVGVSAIDEEKKVLYGGFKYHYWRCIYEHVDKGQFPNADHAQERECDTLPTRTILFPKKTLLDIGLLEEEKLPHTASDFEWTIRAKNHGYQLVILNQIWIETSMKDKFLLHGKKQYKEKKLQNFIKDFRNPYCSGNVYELYHFAHLVFSSPYRYYYLSYKVTRRCLGFVFSNYIFPLFKKTSLSTD